MSRSARRMACAAAACALLATIATVLLDGAADRSFAWHMAEHVLLLFALAPALVALNPAYLLARAAPKPAFAGTVRALRPLQRLAHPAICAALFVAVLWFTHFTGIYEASLRSPAIHAAEHGLYVLAGIAFWLPVFGPPPLRPLPFPGRILYVLLLMPQGALLALALDGAALPLYPHYVAAEGAAAALRDQHDAAAVMWIGGGMAGFVALLATLAVWAAREARAEARA